MHAIDTHLTSSRLQLFPQLLGWQNKKKDGSCKHYNKWFKELFNMRKKWPLWPLSALKAD